MSYLMSCSQEDCALENVWNMGGLSVLSSAPVMPPYVCFLCASKGQHEVSVLNTLCPITRNVRALLLYVTLLGFFLVMLNLWDIV